LTISPFCVFAAPGSFDTDSHSNDFQLGWDTVCDLEAWIANEQLTKCFELCLVQTITGLPHYEKKLRYVCSRHRTGGTKDYTK
jgi:hypothetical protein